jgi:hypothetical protein
MQEPTHGNAETNWNMSNKIAQQAAHPMVWLEHLRGIACIRTSQGTQPKVVNLLLSTPPCTHFLDFNRWQAPN